MRIVLSHPYSNSLTWWFDCLANDEWGGDKRLDHPYYRHIWSGAEAHLDVALTGLIVFEEVILPGLDAPYPGADMSADRPQNPDLGFTVDWEHTSIAQQFLHKRSAELLADPSVADALATVDPGGHDHELMFAVSDILLSAAYDAPVVCSAGRQQLVTALLDLGVGTDLLGAPSNRADFGAFDPQMSGYVDLAGMRFQRRSWESIADLKANARVRTYADAFQSYLTESSTDRDPRDLVDAIADASDAARDQRELVGLFTATSRTMGVAGFVPGLGTVASGIALAADAATARAEKKLPGLAWHEFGPEILRVESLHALENAIDARRRSAQD